MSVASGQGGKIRARLKVRFKDLAAFISEYQHNISKGGIFVRSQKPFAVGDLVEIVLVLPEVEEEVAVKGKVLHVVAPAQATAAQPSGMGVDIRSMAVEDRLMIEEFIKIHTEGAAAGMERREHKRHESRIRVRFGSLEALMEEYVHNISHGGIFIRTIKPKPLQEKVKIILTHPETSEEMIMEGEVVRVVSEADGRRTNQPPGMGVKFTDMDNYLKDQLQAFINSSAVLRNKRVEIEEV